MIAGLGGELLSHDYVEEQLSTRSADAERDARFARALLRWWRQVSRALGPASSARAVMEVAAAPLLHLLDLERPAMSPIPCGLAGQVPAAAAVAVALPWTSAPASAWRDAVRSGITAEAEWALVFNGQSLSIVDCARPWTRAAIEFDFDRLTADPRGITVLRMLAAAPALTGELRARVVASDAHAAGVCRSLGDGVLAVLPRLADALSSGHAGARPMGRRATALDQALTLVYRILFLLFAEARALVPVWHELYRDAYTIDALARKAAGARAPGLWAALQAISRLAHAGCQAGDLSVTAFNGRLFSPRHAPLVEQRRVSDAVAREVLLSLATRPSRHGRIRISYHDLGVEQLGSVYERVLEYQPSSRRDVLAKTSIERKATGSFYTPRSMTGLLVRHALAPLVAGRTADEVLALRVLDPSMGSGAFLVAACHYLADHCELALIREGRWSAGDVTAGDRASLRRQVAERCLYGVDLNPTAVQLARLSLWLTTLAGDRPLTFLDHHLATGNSLIGARLCDLSRPPGRVAKPRAPLPLFDDQVADAVSLQVLPARWRLALEPSDSPEIVRNKERTLAALQESGGFLSRWIAAADAWCAATLWPGPPPAHGVVAEWIAAATGGATTLSNRQLQAALGRARAIAASHGAFHWELAFPEVFFDARGALKADGGFDAVIGNPPWDMLRADLGSLADRTEARAAAQAALGFFRASGLYQHQGGGHPNRYQLFLERALQLARPGGRIGLILPSGIATDHGSARLRRRLLDGTAIDAWLGFDNRHRLFPIHRSMRFVVLAATNGGATSTLRFRCGLTDPATLDRPEPGETLAVSRSRLQAWSPDQLTIPEVPDRMALGIITSIAGRVPALADPAGWQARFGRELNATDDRPHFTRLAGARDRAALLPIVEGKQLAPFQVDLDRSTFGVPITAARGLVEAATTFEHDRIAYRDVASATNKLTLIAAILPRGTISTHTVFCLKSPLAEDEQWCLLALLNSLVANYLVRLQVTTHVTTALMARLPVPRPQNDSPAFNELVKLSRRLESAGIDGDVAAYADINVTAADLYGLAGDQYAYILNTFPLISESTRQLCWARYVRAHGTTEARNG